MAEVVAVYEVYASTTATVELDDAGDPDLVALWLAEDAHPGISLCHQCDDYINDPEIGDLVGFSVDGVQYERDEETGHWVVSR